MGRWPNRDPPLLISSVEGAVFDFELSYVECPGDDLDNRLEYDLAMKWKDNMAIIQKEIIDGAEQGFFQKMFYNSLESRG